QEEAEQLETVSEQAEAAATPTAATANTAQPAGKMLKIGKLLIPEEKAKFVTKHFIILVLLAAFRSITTYMFTIPNGFAPGGLGGVSSIIYNAVVLVAPGNQTLETIFDPGLTMFIMNIPFIIAAGIVLNKRFAISTFLIVSIYSALMFVLRVVGCPQYDVSGQPEYKILAALAGGACAGFGLGIMLRHNMSMGGTDIVGKILHKKNPDTSAQRWILLCDCIVATCSGILGILTLLDELETMTASQAIVEILTPIFFSFVSLIFGSITTDIVQAGFLSSAVLNIVTDKPDEISSAISEKLHRGVTMSTAVGCYTKVEHKVLTCVVSKRQISATKKIISEIDPLAFTYIVKAHEVAGKGFHSAG
ncbi:MAG: YitT family protein, partial [Clostridia bacterium]|nr:YitT family protein [Clostridia bacterium]